MPSKDTPSISPKRAKKAVQALQQSGTVLFVASKVTELVKSMGLRLGADVKDILNAEIYALVWKAARRAMANDRKTIRGDDF